MSSRAHHALRAKRPVPSVLFDRLQHAEFAARRPFVCKGIENNSNQTCRIEKKQNRWGGQWRKSQVQALQSRSGLCWL
jgi:hypothetical protein